MFTFTKFFVIVVLTFVFLPLAIYFSLVWYAEHKQTVVLELDRDITLQTHLRSLGYSENEAWDIVDQAHHC